MNEPQKGAEKRPSPSIPLPSDGRGKVFGILCAILRPCAGFVPVLVLLFFVGALLWAKQQDPFSRKWFTIKTADGGSMKCVAVLSKPIRPCPVIIYAHGSGGSLMNDGFDLRQMAEMGLATISLEYNQSNGVAFNDQFIALIQYIVRQKWANKNAVAWVGFSLGANRMLDFAAQHPEQQPQLLVQLSGAGLSERQTNGRLELLHHPVLLVYGGQDEIFPVTDTKHPASVLQSNGVPVELKVIPSLPHGMGPERGVVFRSIGEYCRSHLVGKNASPSRSPRATRWNCATSACST